MPRLALFLTTWVLGTTGAVGGSMIGAAFGEHPLLIGAFLGGVIASAAAVRLAEWRGWVTLSSPIGPGLSSLLTGVGAVLANRR